MEHTISLFLGTVCIALTLMLLSQNKEIISLRKQLIAQADFFTNGINNLQSEVYMKDKEIDVLNEALENFKKAPPSVVKQRSSAKPRHRFSLRQKAVIERQYLKYTQASFPLDKLVESLNREFGLEKSYRSYENVWRNVGKPE